MAGLADDARGPEINDCDKDKKPCGSDETVSNGVDDSTGTHRESRQPMTSCLKLDIEFLANNETELRKSVFYHTTNPITRWKIDHSPPIKMTIQILKLICIVTQAVLMMQSPISHYPKFQLEAQDVFANFLLVSSRPPATPSIRGIPYNTYTYHAYTSSDLELTLNSAGRLFYQNLSLLTGAYDFVYDTSGSPRPIEVVLTQYSQATLKPANKTFVVNSSTNTTRFTLVPEENGEGTMYEQFLDVCGRDSCFQRLINMDVNFFLSNIRIIHSSLVHCFLVTVKLSVVPEGGGRLLYTLSADYQCDECVDGTLSYNSENWYLVTDFEVILDVMVLLLCLASAVVTIMVINKSCSLAKAMKIFYRNHLERSLTCWDQTHLFHYWHLINIGSDLAIVPATLLKIVYSLNVSCDALSSLAVVSVRVMLGIGVVLEAAVIMRYTSYFQQFNALSSALNTAFPRLLKFQVPVGILYLAFMLCGWMAFGPFHYNFSDYDASFYTLFSMLNGDDLWNTYTGMSAHDNNAVFIFSQIFITTFLILFIYAVLNLFVSLIIQSYDESRRQDPHLRNEVQKFVFSHPLTPGGKVLRDVLPTEIYSDVEGAFQRQK